MFGGCRLRGMSQAQVPPLAGLPRNGGRAGDNVLPFHIVDSLRLERGMRYTMKLSASQAAQEVGKSVPTITRAIKSGKLSAHKLESGGYEIDPAELFRVFPALTRNDNATPTMLGNETPIENRVLQAQIEAKDEQIALLVSERDDLRRRLDDEASERRQLSQRLLAAPDKPAGERKRSWWPWGRSND